MNLPNYLSMLRLLLVPCFFLTLYYYLTGEEFMLWWTRGILCFIVASDFLDGYLARLRSEVTKLGSLLDPLADKLFVTASYVLLAVYNQVPPWLAIIVVAKDILVTIGWCSVAMLYDKVDVMPSFLGKMATVFQFVTVCVIVLLPKSVPKSILEYVTAVSTILALLHYGYQAIQTYLGSEVVKSKGD